MLALLLIPLVSMLNKSVKASPFPCLTKLMISRMCLRLVSGSKCSRSILLYPSEISDLVGSKIPYYPCFAVKILAVLLSTIMRIMSSSSIMRA